MLVYKLGDKIRYGKFKNSYFTKDLLEDQSFIKYMNWVHDNEKVIRFDPVERISTC